MSRNLKVLGLALVAVFALGAMAASAAQAVTHHFTLDSAPAIMTAEDHENTVYTLTAGEQEVGCTTTKYEGTVSETTGTQVTVTPTYSGCTIQGPFGNINVTVDVNHCAFVLNAETDVNGDAKVELECAPENEITVTYSVFGSSCVIHITPGTPAGGAHFTQTTNATTGKKDITNKITVSGIKYHETGAGICPATHTGEDGTLNGAVTQQAYKDKASGQLTGTGRTTPGNHYTENQSEVQNLELTTT